jgi:hypothetical protein
MEDDRASSTSATPPRLPWVDREELRVELGKEGWPTLVRAERLRWSAPVRAETPEQGRGSRGPAPPRVDSEQGRREKE